VHVFSRGKGSKKMTATFMRQPFFKQDNRIKIRVEFCANIGFP